MDVVLVRWPAEGRRRDQLQELNRPRLLLVAEESAPPVTTDLFEDWVRLPADDADVKARVLGLEGRVAAFGPVEPTLDDDGVLRFGPRWVSIPPVEARLIRVLVDRFGSVVGREALTRAGWPDKEPSRNALDVHVLRLRRRIEAVGLVVRTVRSRGYLLEGADDDALRSVTG